MPDEMCPQERDVRRQAGELAGVTVLMRAGAGRAWLAVSSSERHRGKGGAEGASSRRSTAMKSAKMLCLAPRQPVSTRDHMLLWAHTWARARAIAVLPTCRLPAAPKPAHAPSTGASSHGLTYY